MGGKRWPASPWSQEPHNSQSFRFHQWTRGLPQAAAGQPFRTVPPTAMLGAACAESSGNGTQPPCPAPATQTPTWVAGQALRGSCFGCHQATPRPLPSASPQTWHQVWGACAILEKPSWEKTTSPLLCGKKRPEHPTLSWGPLALPPGEPEPEPLVQKLQPGVGSTQGSSSPQDKEPRSGDGAPACLRGTVWMWQVRRPRMAPGRGGRGPLPARSPPPAQSN